MNVKLNDKTYNVAEGTSLAAFMESIGIKPQGIAVAVGYEVVPKGKWSETILTEGMELMLIQAVSGG